VDFSLNHSEGTGDLQVIQIHRLVIRCGCHASLAIGDSTRMEFSSSMPSIML
jgi:hypothetical protein